MVQYVLPVTCLKCIICGPVQLTGSIFVQLRAFDNKCSSGVRELWRVNLGTSG